MTELELWEEKTIEFLLNMEGGEIKLEELKNEMADFQDRVYETNSSEWRRAEKKGLFHALTHGGNVWVRLYKKGAELYDEEGDR